MTVVAMKSSAQITQRKLDILLVVIGLYRSVSWTSFKSSWIQGDNALLPLGEVKTVEAEITEGTNGRVKMEEGDECWFAQIDEEPQIVA